MSIWIFNNEYRPEISPDYQLSIDSGNTPLEMFSYRSKRKHVLQLKREDLNPTGSHKDRGLTFQLSAHIQEGGKEFVISSSGNSSISIISLIKDTDLKLHIFISERLNSDKQKRFEKIIGGKINIEQQEPQVFNNITVHITQRPVSRAFQFANEHGYIFLRGSTDPYAIEGYKSIAFELQQQSHEHIQNIFIPTSSGTTFEGIYYGFKQMFEQGLIDQMPKLHIVQTSKINTIAKAFYETVEFEGESLADSIVDKVGHRKNDVEKHIRATGGLGWIVNNAMITKAIERLNKNSVDASADGALSLAGYTLAVESQPELILEKNICLITGTK